jgi:SAM-dependent methyltransferase
VNNKIDFNKYSENYIELMNKQHLKYGDIEYYSEHKAKILKSIISKDIENILEFGCGIGRNLSFLQKEFPNSKLYGSDISKDSLDAAKRNNSFIEIIDDNKLYQYKNKFDIIFIAGVYHHIEPKLRDEVTQKVSTLLKDKGIVICFEHNPYNPLTRHMVNTCEFDNDAILLSKKEMKNIFIKSGFKLLTSAYTLFVPPKLKKLNFIEPFISLLPLGGQYYCVFKK